MSRSVEDRLDALRETVRTWDWHQVSVQPAPAPPASAPPASAAPPPAPAAVPLSPRDLFVVAQPPPAEGTTGQPQAFGPLAADAPPAAVTDLVGPAQAPEASRAEPLGVPEDDPASPGPGTRPASHRARANNRIKVAAVVLLAVLAVGGIVEGIRLVTKGSNGSQGDATTQTTATHRHTPVQAPIDAAKLTRYEGYAIGLQQANETATRGFVAAGSTPSSTQVAGIVSAYRTALNLYDFQLHFIAWPTSMQTAIATDHAQFHALLSFLQSFPSVAPTGVSAWLTQLHDRTESTAAADNVIRNDLGLSNSSAWP